MPTEAKSALGAKLLAMDAGAITLGKALERRLAACRVRLRLQKKRLRIGRPGGRPHWFNWGNREVGTGVNTGLRTGNGVKGNDPGGA